MNDGGLFLFGMVLKQIRTRRHCFICLRKAAITFCLLLLFTCVVTTISLEKNIISETPFKDVTK